MMTESNSPPSGPDGSTQAPEPPAKRPPSVPPPPPLPPMLVSTRHTGLVDPVSRPSSLLEKLGGMPASSLPQGSEERPRVYKPVYYFFYGTLTEPKMLQDVLGLETEPVLRDAKTCGFALSNWGQYKALIDGESGATVTGRAYMVQSVEEEYKLTHYETTAYKLAPCNIYFTHDGPDGEGDEEPTVGKTFMYAGDSQALRDRRFDRTLWELQIGQRLPPAWHGEAQHGLRKRGIEESQVDPGELGYSGAEHEIWKGWRTT